MIFRFVAIVRKSIEDYALPNGIVTYDELLVDHVGANFDRTTGKFISPRKGVYLFTFDGFVYGRCNAGELKFYVNGQDSSHIIEQSTDGISSRGINGMKAVILNEGDEVYLRNIYSSCIFGDELHTFTFMGTALLYL